MTPPRDRLIRNIGSVLLGFLAFAFLSLGGTFALHAAFSVDQLLIPGGFAPTPLYIAAQIVLYLITAMAGGWVCRIVAGGRKPVVALTAFLFTLNFFHVLMALTAPNDGPVARTGTESPEVFQSQVLAHQPWWLTVLLPLLLLAGLWLGQRMARHVSK